MRQRGPSGLIAFSGCPLLYVKALGFTVGSPVLPVKLQYQQESEYSAVFHGLIQETKTHLCYLLTDFSAL